MSFRKLLLVLPLVFFLAYLQPEPARAATERDITEILLDGHRVINVVDDFLNFWDQAKGKSLRRRKKLWMLLVENKHREYFERAVYRNADKERRRLLLDHFLESVPERIDHIREFNKVISNTHTNPIIEAIVYFRWRFPEYRHQQEIYWGLSFSQFDGSVRPVGNDKGIPDTLCIGVDVLADYRPEQVRITMLHEFFHLYHFAYLFQSPEEIDLRLPHMPLMIEGMAVAAAEEIYPFQPLSLYLNFSNEELVGQQKSLTDSSRHYLRLIRYDALPSDFVSWFTEQTTEEAPPRGGYMLGYEITKRLLVAHPLWEMARMSPAQLREHAEEQLAAMADENVLIISGGRD